MYIYVKIFAANKYVKTRFANVHDVPSLVMLHTRICTASHGVFEKFQPL